MARIEELSLLVPERILEAIIKVREENLNIKPGYDGVFGEVKIFGDRDREGEAQLGLFLR